MKIGICDDDALWCRQAKEIIQAYGARIQTEMEVVIFQGFAPLENYDGDPPEALFMDIELDGSPANPENPSLSADGIAAARLINRRWADCQIVYLTNYLFYATEVYHTAHIFFALKETFESRIDEIFSKIFHEQQQRNKKLVFSAIGGRKIALTPASILYFERNLRITRVITADCVYEIREKLRELLELLPPLDFARCHNSYIVYLPAVREMEADHFLMENGACIPISRGYAADTKNAFMSWALTQIS